MASCGSFRVTVTNAKDVYVDVSCVQRRVTRHLRENAVRFATEPLPIPAPTPVATVPAAYLATGGLDHYGLRKTGLMLPLANLLIFESGKFRFVCRCRQQKRNLPALTMKVTHAGAVTKSEGIVQEGDRGAHPDVVFFLLLMMGTNESLQWDATNCSGLRLKALVDRSWLEKRGVK